MTARAGRARARRPGARPSPAALPPPWVAPLAMLLSVAGLAVSVYLTVIHFAHVNPYCSNSGLENCAKVTTSAESVVFGIFPVPVLGLVFFVGMLVLQHPRAWASPRPALRWARLASVVVGIGFVAYLIYTELFTLGTICLWCTGVHAITFVLFAVTVFGNALAAPAEPPARARAR